MCLNLYTTNREMLLDNVPVEKIKQYTKASDKEILNVQKLMNPDLKNEQIINRNPIEVCQREEVSMIDFLKRGLSV